jgi:adenosylhomocysteine nucleosidase
MADKKVGIMGAMPEEIESIVKLIDNRQEISIGNRLYHTGTINDIAVVVVFSRWGKVAAATTATSLILEFRVTELFFVGVAGAINHALKIGDIIIADQLIQHDMDARPLMPRYEIPLLNTTYFKSSQDAVKQAKELITALIASPAFQSLVASNECSQFLKDTPRLFTGTIASGDKFFSNEEDKQLLQQHLPEVLCVEMEGAAVAQVCYEYAVPFLVIRTISDTAGEDSHIDFVRFIEVVAQKYAAEIMKQIFYHSSLT